MPPVSLQYPEPGYHSWCHRIAFSADNRKAITGSFDHTAHIWRTDTGESLHHLVEHTMDVITVDISRDGRKALTGSRDRTARLWCGETGACLHRLDHAAAVLVVALSPDASLIFVGLGGHSLQVWGPRELAPSPWRPTRSGSREPGRLCRYYTLEGWILGLAVSPDGRLLAVASNDAPARLWRFKTGEFIHLLGVTRCEDYCELAFSPDSSLLVVSNDQCLVQLLEVETGRLLREFSGHTRMISSLCFSPDGRRLLTSSYDATIRFWDVASGAQLREVRWPTKGYSEWFASISPDGKLATLGSMTQGPRIMRVDEAFEEATFAVLRHEGWRGLLEKDGDRAVWSRVKAFFP